MFGTGEMLLIALVAIIVVDPKKLPDLMKGLGKALGEFKQMSGEFKRTIERETEAADFEKRKAEAHENLYGKGAQTPGSPADQSETQTGDQTGGQAATPDHKPEGSADAAQEHELQPEEYPQQPPVERAETGAEPTGDAGLTPFDTTVEAPASAAEGAFGDAAEAPAASAETPAGPVAEAPSAEPPVEPAEASAPVEHAAAASALAAEPEAAPAERSEPVSEPASETSQSTAEPIADAPAETSAVTSSETSAETSVETPGVPAEEAPAEVPAVSASDLPAPAAEAAAPAVAQEAAAPAVSEPAPAPAVGGDGGEVPPPPKGDDAVGEGFSGRMSLFGHLQDLRKRLTRSAIAMVVGFLVCYAFAGQMLKMLMQPMLNVLKQSHFIYTLPTEAFFTEMKVAFVAGIFAASPYIFYQIFQFIAPGLYSHERRWIIPIAFCSALCFTVGALFGYFVVFPFGFEFFASYASDNLMFTPKLDEYLDFVLKLLFAFGIVFELPLFLFFLARLGVISHVGLRKKRKYAILVAFILAAALTPPDAVSQTMMAVPLCILYEVGIWLAYFFGKKKKPEPEEAAPTEAA